LELELAKYHGREQSYIKHLFLKEYLKLAAFKILQGRSKTFNFVDAFAGPWNVSDKSDFSDTSFHQALDTLETVRSSLGRGGIAGLKINYCFCEKNTEAFKELRNFADEHKKFGIHVFNGKFECHLDEISEICRNGFTFTFIDPTGWKIDSTPIFEFLKNQGGEFLLNFMAEHINRHAGYSKVSASFGRFLANPNWKADFDSLPPKWSNEVKVLTLLKKNMKSNGIAEYLPDFPIGKPNENRLKMRLILGTNSPIGLEVFRNVQKNIERKEIQMRNERTQISSNQPSLFSDDQITKLEQETIGVGCLSYQKLAKKRIVELLNQQQSMAFDELAIDVLENVPITKTQIKNLANRLKTQNLICFELPPRKRVPQEETIIKLVQ